MTNRRPSSTPRPAASRPRASHPAGRVARRLVGRLPAHTLPVVATTAATALIAALGTSLVPSGAASAEQSVEDASVSALSELPPRVVAAPAATPQRASRGAARTPPRATKLVWRSVAVGPAFRGEASWYGPGFQGRTTANGERYDMYAMTAAHKTLPFGTRLKVCRGERCVVVRINDRGPYAGGRVLDLSKAAAQQLGYSGTAWVSATPVRQKQVRVPA